MEEKIPKFVYHGFMTISETQALLINLPTNTYNYENNLSQVLLFRVFVINNEPYVLLQIHGGCDVRGGYTDIKCFKLEGYLTGNPDVYGTINDIEVSNTYNGWSLTDESGDDLELKENNDISLDFYIMEDCEYLYTE